MAHPTLAPWSTSAALRRLPLAQRILHVRLNLQAPVRPGKPNLNQKEFGELVGVTDRQVKRWESGKSDPEEEARMAIAAVTGYHYQPDDFRPSVDSAELRALRRELDQLNTRLAEIEKRAGK